MLIDVKCPFKIQSKKHNGIYDCNRLCGRFEPGSAGELWCPKCKLRFNFETVGDKQYTHVRVQKEGEPNPAF